MKKRKAFKIQLMMEQGIDNSVVSVNDPSSETNKRNMSNQCFQCSYKSPNLGDMKKHVEIHVGKSQTSAANVTFPHLGQGL